MVPAEDISLLFQRVALIIGLFGNFLSRPFTRRPMHHIVDGKKFTHAYFRGRQTAYASIHTLHRFDGRISFAPARCYYYFSLIRAMWYFLLFFSSFLSLFLPFTFARIVSAIFEAMLRNVRSVSSQMFEEKRVENFILLLLEFFFCFRDGNEVCTHR